MKKILILITFFILIMVFVTPLTFLWKKECENRLFHSLGGSSNKTKSNKIQFLYFRIYHLINEKPIESYQHGQKDIFPFMRKFDLVDSKLIVYSNVRGCEALIGTLGLLCCLNEFNRMCNFSFGVESLYGISYGVSKFLPAKNYSLNLSFAWDGENISMFHKNKKYHLSFGKEVMQLNDSFAWVSSDSELRVVVKPYVEFEYLQVEILSRRHAE